MSRRPRRSHASAIKRRSANINQTAAILLLCAILAMILLFKDTIATGLSNVFQASSADLTQTPASSPSP